MMPRFRVTVIAVCMTLAGASAWPHALHMFVSVDGGVISGDVYYSDGKPAVKAAVLITTPAGANETIITGDDGLFSYPTLAPGAYTVVADSNDGHRVEQTVEVGDAQPSPGVVASYPPHAEPTTGAASASGAELDAALRAAVRQEIRPLREELNHFQNSARIRDIVAGIGYIVGFFGLLAWLQARRRTRGGGT